MRKRCWPSGWSRRRAGGGAVVDFAAAVDGGDSGSSDALADATGEAAATDDHRGMDSSSSLKNGAFLLFALAIALRSLKRRADNVLEVGEGMEWIDSLLYCDDEYNIYTKPMGRCPLAKGCLVTLKRCLFVAYGTIVISSC